MPTINRMDADDDETESEYAEPLSDRAVAYKTFALALTMVTAVGGVIALLSAAPGNHVFTVGAITIGWVTVMVAGRIANLG